MRSRYSAFVTKNAEHLQRSWWPPNCPAQIEFDPKQRWLGLVIKSTSSGLAEDAQGTVEFVARYKIDGKAYRLHERSQFRCYGGQWYYVSGEQRS